MEESNKRSIEMSKLLKKHLSFFQLFLSTSSKLQRKVLVDTITNDQLRALTEITVNVLQGVLPITSIHKPKLIKYRKLVRLIGDTSVSLKTKKSALRRKANVVTLLLKSVEPALKKVLS